jgi:hypothetical protein
MKCLYCAKKDGVGRYVVNGNRLVVSICKRCAHVMDFMGYKVKSLRGVKGKK